MGPWTVKESAVTSVFRANNFYYPVEVTTEVSPPLTSFPWIKPSNFLGAMSKMNDLDHLLGGLSLKESRGRLVKFLGEIPTAVPTASAVATSWFWSERNSILHTSPTAWRRRSHLQEEWTISFEFSGSYWTWMWQGVVHDNLRAQSDGVPLNFLRTGFQTRLLICVCPKDLSVVVFPSN